MGGQPATPGGEVVHLIRDMGTACSAVHTKLC